MVPKPKRYHGYIEDEETDVEQEEEDSYHVKAGESVGDFLLSHTTLAWIFDGGIV